MTDRELLELAAKAAGVKYEKHYESEDGSLYIVHGQRDAELWNPLTDDGDALRLAVRLGITDLSLNVGNLLLEYEPDCKLTGTDIVRRAIVRAAAEVGKTK